jgi:hypothetical protein
MLQRDVEHARRHFAAARGVKAQGSGHDEPFTTAVHLGANRLAKWAEALSQAIWEPITIKGARYVIARASNIGQGTYLLCQKENRHFAGLLHALTRRAYR